MIEPLPMSSANILGFKLSGKLHDEDYQTFVPLLEAAIAAHDQVRLFAQFEDFQGWDLHAAWDDFKFGVQHYADFERIAMVGDRQWEAWMSRLCKPFTRAAVRYFDVSEADAARAWISEGV